MTFQVSARVVLAEVVAILVFLHLAVLDPAVMVVKVEIEADYPQCQKKG